MLPIWALGCLRSREDRTGAGSIGMHARITGKSSIDAHRTAMTQLLSPVPSVPIPIPPWSMIPLPPITPVPVPLNGVPS